MTNTLTEIKRRAWEHGARDAIFAQAYGWLTYSDDGEILTPIGVLSGEMAGESISELIPETASMVDDDGEYDAACDAYEGAYSDGYTVAAEWADVDGDEWQNEMPFNPFDVFRVVDANTGETLARDLLWNDASYIVAHEEHRNVTVRA